MAHSSTLITRESWQADFEKAGIAVVTEGVVAQMARLTVQPTLQQKIIESQQEDPNLTKILSQLTPGLVESFSKLLEGRLLCKGRLCVPIVEELKNKILTEAHNSPFSIHPDSIKIYQYLKQHFWW